MLEQEECLPYSINAILLSPKGIASSLYNHNPVIHNSVRIWKRLKTHFKFTQMSFLFSISANPSFCPSMLDFGKIQGYET